MGPIFFISAGIIWLFCTWLLWRRERHGRATRLSYADLLCGGLLFAITAGFFWRTLSGDVYQPADGGDLVSFLFPVYRFAASQLSQGVMPLWNPHLYGGAPLVGDIQAGFLYPPNLLLFLVNPEFGYETMQWLSIGHFYWAGLGTYVLLRTLTWRDSPVARPAALFGAVAFEFSDPLLIHLGNLNLIAVLSWLPWILAAYHRGLAKRDLRWTAVTAVLYAIAIYAGHAQSMFYIALALGIYTLLWIAFESSSDDDELSEKDEKEEWRWRTLIQPLFALLLVGGLTLLLAAPVILPAVEMAQFTERSDFTYQETVAFSLAPTQALGLLTPGFFGRGPALHWSLWQRIELPYAGVATLILAIAALLLADRTTRRKLWPWVGLAIFGFVVALGIYAILHGWLTQLAPGFGQLRAPARALILWTLGLSVLAAVGLDRLMQAPSIETTRYGRVHAFLKTVGLLLAGFVTPLAYLALLLTQENETMFLRASVAAIAITLATAFWLVTWALIAARRAAWMSANLFGGLMVALLLLDLSATGAYTDISPTDPTSGFDHPEIAEFLRGDPEIARIDTRTDIDDLWQPDSAALIGLEDVGGIANPLMLQHWAEMWAATGGRHTRIYDMLNAKYVLVRDGAPLPAGKFKLAFDAPGDLAIFLNLDAAPRAWLVHEARRADDEIAFDLMLTAGFDPRTQVLLPFDTAIDLTPATGPESVTIEEVENHSLKLAVAATAPAYLVLSEVWYPGWQATVNGAPTEVLRANGALRALALPAGDAQVELWFAPRMWAIGWIAFAVGLLALLLLFLFAKRLNAAIDK